MGEYLFVCRGWKKNVLTHKTISQREDTDKFDSIKMKNFHLVIYNRKKNISLDWKKCVNTYLEYIKDILCIYKTNTLIEKWVKDISRYTISNPPNW